MNFVGSKAVAVYPPETSLIPISQNISFDTFFLCLAMCIATFLLIILMSLIMEEKDYG